MNGHSRNEYSRPASSAPRFFPGKRYRRFLYLFLLGIPVLAEFSSAALARRTFVFYDLDTGEAMVEERMLPRTSSEETAIRWYVEEVLLGPVSPEAAPLFSRETGLRSLLYRDGVVYADLSLSAALPYSEGGSFRSLYVLNAGIRRNFSSVRDVRLFIEGSEAFFERFRGAFVKSVSKNDKSV
jgi:hypothetical protein